MSLQSLSFAVSFRDVQFLQRHMARRLFLKNRPSNGLALLGVVLCATFLALALATAAHPYSSFALFAYGVPYPSSFFLLIILYLVGAIAALIPGVRLRLRTLNMQVASNSPFLGHTKLILQNDGLIVERPLMSAKYLWGAFQGIEIVKTAVVLPLDNGVGLIIPASAFSSDAERFDFAAMISKRIGNQVGY